MMQWWSVHSYDEKLFKQKFVFSKIGFKIPRKYCSRKTGLEDNQSKYLLSAEINSEKSHLLTGWFVSNLKVYRYSYELKIKVQKNLSNLIIDLKFKTRF